MAPRHAQLGIETMSFFGKKEVYSVGSWGHVGSLHSRWVSNFCICCDQNLRKTTSKARCGILLHSVHGLLNKTSWCWVCPGGGLRSFWVEIGGGITGRPSKTFKGIPSESHCLQLGCLSFNHPTKAASPAGTQSPWARGAHSPQTRAARSTPRQISLGSWEPLQPVTPTTGSKYAFPCGNVWEPFVEFMFCLL